MNRLATPSQYGLFAPDRTIDQRFADWKLLPGAGKVLEMFYREAAFYYRRYCELGVKCSVALIEEKVRDSIRLATIEAVPEDGFALNCHFCCRIVRRMIEEHSEWKPMFELPETGKERMRRRVMRAWAKGWRQHHADKEQFDLAELALGNALTRREADDIHALLRLPKNRPLPSLRVRRLLPVLAGLLRSYITNQSKAAR